MKKLKVLDVCDCVFTRKHENYKKYFFKLCESLEVIDYENEEGKEVSVDFSDDEVEEEEEEEVEN